MGWRIFGVPFDPLDCPEKVALQKAYLFALEKGLLPANHPLDPYDLILNHLPAHFLGSQVKPLDKFPIPSWLRPRPLSEDIPTLEPVHFTHFLDSGGCEEITLDLQRFVSSKLFPDRPLMLGIDHCLTGGVLRALSERIGPEAYSLLVLDSHFDGIPLRLRRQPNSPRLLFDSTLTSPSIYQGAAADDSPHLAEYYCCGNFLNYLLVEETILPKNTFLIGVTDHPFYYDLSCLDPGQKQYRESYEGFQRMGITLIPGGEDEPLLIERLEEVLDNIPTRWAYLSIDADIGARNAIYATRFLERKGLSYATIGRIFDLIARQVKRGALHLLGVDLMEINVHLAGVNLPTGGQDQTPQLFARMLQKLFQTRTNEEQVGPLHYMSPARG